MIQSAVYATWMCDIGLGDHLETILRKNKIQKVESVIYVQRNYRNCLELFAAEVARIDWYEVCSAEDIGSAVNAFNKRLINI